MKKEMITIGAITAICAIVFGLTMTVIHASQKTKELQQLEEQRQFNLDLEAQKGAEIWRENNNLK